MSLASHGSERDTGHTGNFFNLLWAMPGVAHSGSCRRGVDSGVWGVVFRPRSSLGRQFFSSRPPEPGFDSYADGIAADAIFSLMPCR